MQGRLWVQLSPCLSLTAGEAPEGERLFRLFRFEESGLGFYMKASISLWLLALLGQVGAEPPGHL